MLAQLKYFILCFGFCLFSFSCGSKGPKLSPAELRPYLNSYKEKLKNAKTGEEKYKIAFEKLKEKDLYKMFIDKKRLDQYDGPNPHLLFDDEKGYFEAMRKAFKGLAAKMDHPIDLDELVTLHDEAVDEVKKKDGSEFTKGIVLGTNQYGISPKKASAEAKSDWYKYKLIYDPSLANSRPDYIQRNFMATLEDDNVVSNLEIWSNFLGNQDALKVAHQYLDPVYAEYHFRIKNAKTDNDVLAAISIWMRSVQTAHVLPDGNTRAITFLTLPKLLIQNNLPPAILEDPIGIDSGNLGTSEMIQGIWDGIFNYIILTEGL